ncbi:MAG TPA: site-2 protease family protein [Thermomicrobiaceae bacterium]|nr:site-2 protease family protein [Thermomicrobiaceae bacterium]
MGRAVRVATIRNIQIKLHPTILFALLWVVYYWGVVSGAGLRGAVFGAFVLVAVFACVVGHELAHSFVAQRYGLTVHDITLLPIGGVARIEQVPLPPRQEARIALAGPILNGLVAICLLPLALLLCAERGVHDLVSFVGAVEDTTAVGLVLYLWLANLMLAVFNLLPAFPMDGGRLLRAMLTAVSNRVLATRIAVVFGQVMALLLVGAAFYTRDVALPLVAIFIVVAAFVEARMIHVESSLQALPVSQFAVWDMGGVSPDVPLARALRGGPRDVAVTHDGVVVGMLWRDDLLRELHRGDQVRVRDVMDHNVMPMDVDSTVYEVHRRMITSGRPAIAITESGIYRGIFTSDRLVHVHRYLQDDLGSRDRYRGIMEALGLLGR